MDLLKEQIGHNTVFQELWESCEFSKGLGDISSKVRWGVYVVPYRALSSLGQLDVSKQINVT